MRSHVVGSNSCGVSRNINIHTVDNRGAKFTCTSRVDLLTLRRDTRTTHAVIHSDNSNGMRALNTMRRDPLCASMSPLRDVDHRRGLSVLHHISGITHRTSGHMRRIATDLDNICRLVLITTASNALTTSIHPLIHLSIDILIRRSNGHRHNTDNNNNHFNCRFFLTSLSNRIHTST